MKSNKENFIAKAKDIHKGENLDYSKVVYKNNRTPVCIIDHDIDENGNEYGEFWQTPYNHLKGQSHPKKRNKKISLTKRFDTSDFIKKAMEVHKGENLDYSKVVYKGAHEKVYIIDHSLKPDGTEYGGYWQEANSHLKGSGHPLKAINKNTEFLRDTTDDFIKKVKKIHGDRYDYSKVSYINNKERVTLICKKHGEFSSMPYNLLAGKGCPKCGNILSKAEDEIYNYIVQYIDKNDIERNNRSILNGKEIDIFVRPKNVAIEYNGIRWHCEEFNKGRNYHIDKLNECSKMGITLIQIFEDEYKKHKELTLSKIGHILGIETNKPKIMGRKTLIKEIANKEGKKFLEEFHIQGSCGATKYIGAFYNNELIGVMCFLEEKKNSGKWNLVRFSTNFNYVCQGVGGKLFKYFVKNYNPKEIKTFLDRRWEHNSENNLYIKLGFTFDKIIPPDYRYTDGHGERWHKFGFRKNKLLKLDENGILNPNMTENEMRKALGLKKIWDCGLIKYVWKVE